MRRGVAGLIAIALAGASCNSATYLTVTVESGAQLHVAKLAVTVTNGGQSSTPIDIAGAAGLGFPPSHSVNLQLDGRSGAVTVEVRGSDGTGQLLGAASGQAVLIPGGTVAVTLALTPPLTDLGAPPDQALLPDHALPFGFAPGMTIHVSPMVQISALASGLLDTNPIVDLVVGSSDGWFRTYLGAGNGTFKFAQGLAPGPTPSSFAIRDLDGDGYNDVVIGFGQPATVIVEYGQLDGSYKPFVVQPSVMIPIAVATGDFDGNGDLDIIAAVRQSKEIAFYGGDGSGAFPLTNGSGTSMQSPVAMVVGDFNNDQKLDAVVANGDIDSIGVSDGLGTGLFNAPRDFTVGANPTAMALGDLDGDKVNDLAVTVGGSASLAILLGNPDGTFKPRKIFATGNAPVGLVLGDFDGDCVLDAAVIDQSVAATRLSLLIGNGDGTFGPRLTFDAGMLPTAIAAGDFDRDGRLDLAIGDGTSDVVQILMNQYPGKCN